jgi:anaerobic selenocysteine-containing dehydrogenase
MQLKPLKLSRRGFLKGSAITAGALSLGLLDFQSWAKTSAEAPVSRIPTICNGCGNRCALFAYVKNGRIWRIEGNPEANGNQGVLCPKAHGYLHDLYNPNRIRTPLKRVEGKFQPISWEQAYQEITQKINLILLEMALNRSSGSIIRSPTKRMHSGSCTPWEVRTILLTAPPAIPPVTPHGISLWENFPPMIWQILGSS